MIRTVLSYCMDNTGHKNAVTASNVSGEEKSRQATSIQTSWNLFNAIEGVGILGMPFAIKIGGDYALFGIVVVGMVSVFTGALLVDCLFAEIVDDSNDANAKTSLLTTLSNAKPLKVNGRKLVRARESYPEIGKAVIGSFGHVCVLLIQIVSLTGVCVLYVVLVASTLETAANEWFHTMLQGIPGAVYSCVATLIMTPLLLFGTLDKVSWLSLVGVVSLVLAVLVICIDAGWELAGSPSHDWHAPSASHDMTHISTALSMITFSFSAHGQYPGIEASMSKPSRFKFVLALTVGCAAFIKVIFAFLSLAAFGSDTVSCVFNVEFMGWSHVAICIVDAAIDLRLHTRGKWRRFKCTL